MKKHILIIDNDAHVIENGQIIESVINIFNNRGNYTRDFISLYKKHELSSKPDTYYFANSLETHLKNLERDKFLEEFEQSNKEFPKELFL